MIGRRPAHPHPHHPGHHERPVRFRFRSQNPYYRRDGGNVDGFRLGYVWGNDFTFRLGEPHYFRAFGDGYAERVFRKWADSQGYGFLPSYYIRLVASPQ